MIPKPVRQALALGVVGLGLRPWFPPAPLIALLVLAWLHLR